MFEHTPVLGLPRLGEQTPIGLDVAQVALHVAKRGA